MLRLSRLCFEIVARSRVRRYVATSLFTRPAGNTRVDERRYVHENKRDISTWQIPNIPLSSPVRARENYAFLCRMSPSHFAVSVHVCAYIFTYIRMHVQSIRIYKYIYMCIFYTPKNTVRNFVSLASITLHASCKSYPSTTTTFFSSSIFYYLDFLNNCYAKKVHV